MCPRRLSRLLPRGRYRRHRASYSPRSAAGFFMSRSRGLCEERPETRCLWLSIPPRPAAFPTSLRISPTYYNRQTYYIWWSRCWSARRGNGRWSGACHGLAAAHGARRLLGNPEEEARAHPCFGQGGARPGLSHRCASEPMSLVTDDISARHKCGEPSPSIGQTAERQNPSLRRRSRASLCSTSANFVGSGVLSTKLRRAPHLSRELLHRQE